MANTNGNFKTIYTKSFSYILPMCGKTYSDFSHCKGCFVGDKTKPELKGKIFILYDKNFSLFEYENDIIISNENYCMSYDINDSLIMYVYDVPDKYKEDYDKFLKGQYFEISSDYKMQIINFHSEVHDVERIKDVLYKSNKLYEHWEKKLDVKIPRTQNIGSIPNMEKEEFDYMMVTKEEWI